MKQQVVELETHKDQELETICEVIRDCFNLDPRKRPTMKEVTSKLRDVIQISPEAATFSTLVGGAGDRICRSKLIRSLFLAELCGNHHLVYGSVYHHVNLNALIFLLFVVPWKIHQLLLL